MSGPMKGCFEPSPAPVPLWWRSLCWMRMARPRLTFSRKSHQGAPIFTHPLHHPANATLFPAKSAQEPIESPVFL
jgi:hypothetical protein